uniref:Splicing regulatory glutamic acid and lysine rich protein 1 n=1 Tax=Homo sapiens TaxID=9606 RepID=E5RK30_HUMAN
MNSGGGFGLGLGFGLTPTSVIQSSDSCSLCRSDAANTNGCHV